MVDEGVQVVRRLPERANHYAVDSSKAAQLGLNWPNCSLRGAAVVLVGSSRLLHILHICNRQAEFVAFDLWPNSGSGSGVQKHIHGPTKKEDLPNAG